MQLEVKKKTLKNLTNLAEDEIEKSLIELKSMQSLLSNV